MAAPAVPETNRAEYEPGTMVVPEMAHDQLDRKRADRLIHGAGHIAVEAAIEPGDNQPRHSLKEGIDRAAWGDYQSRQMVRKNVATDVIERVFKAGHVLPIDLDVDENGKILQYGHLLDEVQMNALQFAAEGRQMTARTKAEARNSVRLETANRMGLLKDYYFVVISRAADDMTKQELKDNNFFADTMTCVIQATTASPNGLHLESAFVAGISQAGGEQHDAATVVGMAAELGVDYQGMSATDIIDTPLLVPKSLMPNGVVDLVKLYDQAAGGTFFGEAKPAQDYLKYLEVCRQRERDFDPMVDTITKQLIKEAGSFKTPTDATNRLHELSQEMTVERAVTDTDINPMVFGLAAARHIEMARHYMEQGETDKALIQVSRAQATAESSSCPYSRRKAEAEAQSAEQKGPEEKEDNTGSIRCIQCRKYVFKSAVVKKDCWECPKCLHKVDICTGKTLRTGKIEAPEAAEDAVVISLAEKIAAKKTESDHTVNHEKNGRDANSA